MAVKDWLIGTLISDGCLMTESGKILLTTLPKGRHNRLNRVRCLLPMKT